MAGSAAPNAARAGVGVGLRQPHYAQVLADKPALGFIEVHSENFFADGGAALGVLEQARASYEVSLHGVGLGLGSAAGIDRWHLERLARLAQRVEPLRVSDHACFARAPLAPGQGVVHGNDLLPIAFTRAALDILVANVTQVQERLRRPLLVENLSAYLSFKTAPDEAAMDEPAFFAELCRRAGCGMLLDVNNLMVNALNALNLSGHPGGHAGRAAVHQAATHMCCAFVDALPPGTVGEVHLAGYCEAEALVIDDHGSRVRPEVWAVFAHALQRFGALPTLVEWDTDVPTLDVLLAEADHAAALMAQGGNSAKKVFE